MGDWVYRHGWLSESVPVAEGVGVVAEVVGMGWLRERVWVDEGVAVCG